MCLPGGMRFSSCFFFAVVPDLLAFCSLRRSPNRRRQKRLQRRVLAFAAKANITVDSVVTTSRAKREGGRWLHAFAVSGPSPFLVCYVSAVWLGVPACVSASPLCKQQTPTRKTKFCSCCVCVCVIPSTSPASKSFKPFPPLLTSQNNRKNKATMRHTAMNDQHSKKKHTEARHTKNSDRIRYPSGTIRYDPGAHSTFASTV